MSRTAAESRTLRATTCSFTRPPLISPKFGANDTRPRLGFRPNSPQQLAGMRIDPPPSFACATGTMPLATAHAEPPLDPPVERVVSYGFLDGGHAGGSADGTIPNSEVFVFPTMTNPACRSRATKWLSCGAR